MIKRLNFRIFLGNKQFTIFFKRLKQSNFIKVDVRPELGNNGSNFGQNINHKTTYFHKSLGRQVGGEAGRNEQGRIAQLVHNIVQEIKTGIF
jgi:hypothetical protein